MRRIAFALLGLLLFAPGAAGGTDVDPYWLESIPPEYHGRWNGAAGTCAPFTGRHRLQISGNEIVVGGDRFRNEYIAWDPDGGIGLVSRYVGPATPWTRVDHFSLSRDGKTLTDSHARRTVIRRRCPE